MINLKKIDSSNLWDIVALSVGESQKNFVASNSDSIMEAYTMLVEGHVALPFGIYSDDVPVGFVMFGYGNCCEEEEPLIAKGNYCLWRFMIDKNFQRRGYGRDALAAAIAYVKTFPCGKAEYCWLSYEPENTVAKRLYESFGFRETGEMCDDEIVSALKLD